MTVPHDIPNIREFCDFWYNRIGVNVIPFYSRAKIPIVKWKRWQNKPVTLERHEVWRKSGMYDSGIAIITGEISRGENHGRYLNCIDLDNEKAIKEFLTIVFPFFHANSLAELSRLTIVEQHSDSIENKAHIYFVTETSIKKRGRLIRSVKNSNSIEDENIPAIEIKSDSTTLVTVTPSVHKDGFPYLIRGTNNLITLTKNQSLELETILDKFYEKYDDINSNYPENCNSILDDYLKKIARELEINREFDLYKIQEGARNKTLFDFGFYLLSHHKNSKKIQQIKDFFFKVNQEICSTPLADNEIETIWNQCTNYVIDSDEDKSKPEKNQLLELIEKKIDLLFKDQFNEGFAKIFINDHYEIISVKSTRFKRLVQKIYYEDTSRISTADSITSVVNILQAKAEFGDYQYNLSLRVASYEGNFYYDLTDEKHRCVKISPGVKWEILDDTPIPLFKRYNQVSQNLQGLKAEASSFDKENNPIEYFLSNLTNIGDKDTKLLVKVSLISYFVPEISHVILLIHGSKGSAKSTFLRLIKELVDPSKPVLLTLHNNSLQFIQQLAHNYLASFDNIKYVHPWLPDEACRAVTGIGQTKRELFTDDEDKIYEYKHCLNFNGINLAFSEPDVLDRSIIIELSEIEDEKRKTEQEILEKFHELRPSILEFIFDIIGKAMTIKNDLSLDRLSRMADFERWGEAISRALGYKDHEFIHAYHKNIGFQNDEVIDANPLAFAIKCFVENRLSLFENNFIDGQADVEVKTSTIFEGSPGDLLEEINKIAADEKINTIQKEWPKDRKWLVKRLRIIKANLQKGTNIKIEIGRNSKNNSLIRIVKFNSDNSSVPTLSPENESLSPYFDKLTPDNSTITPDKDPDSNTHASVLGDTGDTGDKIHNPIVGDLDDCNNNNSKQKVNELLESEPRIGYNHPFYYCKQHSKVQNIHFDEIKRHLELSRDHCLDHGD